MLTILTKIDSILFTIIKAIVIVLYMAMVVLIAAQVYTRFLTTSSLTWSEELARFTLAYTVFLSAVLVTRIKGHICIDDAVRRLPESARRVVLCISSILQIIFFAIVLWGAFRMFPTAALRVSPALSIPMPVVYFCVPLSCLMMLVYNIRDLVELLAKKEKV